MLSNLITRYDHYHLDSRRKYYVDQIEQITRWMLIAQNTKLANHQLMFLNKAFQPKSQRQGIIFRKLIAL